LVQEGKVVQYRLLRAAVQVGPKINLGHDLWKGFLTEQLGIIGKGYNPLTIEQGMRDNHHGQTLNRSCRERVWEAAVPRQCTDEEITKGCRDCGSRMDADGATLVDDSNRWYKVRFHYEQGPGVQKFRVEEYGLPDLPDDELVQHFTTHPLPTWYRRGINFDIHTATGPDDERFPPTTIKAVFRNTQDPGMEARYACWAEEFIAEVQVCVERFRGSDELPHELARLIAELQAFNIGDGEAKNCITALRSTTAGANALNIVQAGKDRLLLRLEKVATTATTKPKPAKARPSIPTIAEKFAKVPGSLDKWMGLLRSEGLADSTGRFTMASDAKGKGKLIAAWTAAQELFQLDGYATDKELVQALKNHIHDLTGLDRLDKVRSNMGFSGLVTEYKEDLEVD